MNATADRSAPTAAQIARATPVSRDRFVDLLRAVSIAVVVFGHLLMAVVVWRDGRVEAQNALEILPGAWAATWVLQVMPLFFFVGGFSNYTALESLRRRGGGRATFMRSRLVRLLRPTAVFAAATLAGFAIMRAAGLNGETFDQAARVVAKPLWFLAVYILVVALAPVASTLHRRFGIRVVIAMAAGAVAVDVLRIGFGVPLIGALNYALVWLIPHQIGFLYADGTLTRLRRRATATMAAGGLAALAALTSIGVYSRSMVGTSDPHRWSNNSPPSICLIALAVWLIGLAMLARPRATTWLERPRAWRAVVVANSMIMTVFLWHLAAMMIAAAILLPSGFPQPPAGSAFWWLLRPLWVGAALLVLVPFVAVFGRAERAGLRARTPAKPPAPAAMAAATMATVAGLAGLATWGFSGSLLPGAASTAAVWIGLRLCRAPASPEASPA